MTARNSHDDAARRADEHRRQRIRRLGREVAVLTAYRAELEQLLGAVCILAARTLGSTPLVVLDAAVGWIENEDRLSDELLGELR